MSEATDWHKYAKASLNPTQAFNEAASQNAGASVRNPKSVYRGPAKLQAQLPQLEEATPTSFDRALGLSVVLGLAVIGAVSIHYLSYVVAEFLFGV